MRLQHLYTGSPIVTSYVCILFPNFALLVTKIIKKWETHKDYIFRHIRTKFIKNSSIYSRVRDTVGFVERISGVARGLFYFALFQTTFKEELWFASLFKSKLASQFAK